MNSSDLELPKFAVGLILGGIDLHIDPDAILELSNELSIRPHVRKSRISWENQNKGEISAYMETEALDADSAGKDMAEELFEVACGSLHKVVGIHIDVIWVQPIINDHEIE